MMLSSYKLKIIGEIFLLLPTTFLLLLGIGEILSEDMSGVQHFAELIPIMIVAYFCWRQPKIGSVLLAIAAMAATSGYLIFFKNSSLLFRLTNAALLFLPFLLAGVFFFIASINEQKKFL